MSGELDVALDTVIRQRAGAISGVVVTDVYLSPSMGTISGVEGTRRILNVQLEGWSPSLHRQRMHWKANIRTDQQVDLVVKSAIQAFSSHLDRQRSRLKAGFTLGVSTPFNVDFDKGGVPVDHILIDRTLAHLLVVQDDRQIEEIVAEAISDLHRTDVGNGLEDAIYNDDRIHERTFSSLVKLGQGVYYDGVSLTIPQSLPEAVRTAAVGRRCGDLVDLPFVLCEHVILQIEDEGDYTDIRLSGTLKIAIGDIVTARTAKKAFAK